MTDRYNVRGMISNQTLKAYDSKEAAFNATEIREFLWKGDEYYCTLDARISNMWKKTASNVIHEKIF
jgi:hypothetical protein